MKDSKYIKFSILIFTIIISFLNTNLVKAQIKNVKVTKIWNKAPYNAFTDLIRFNNKFYCTFREGTGHIPKKNGQGNGKIRIISSKDGKNWKSVALLKENGWDLRDPKLSIAPKEKLMVNMGGSKYDGHKLLNRLSFVSFLNSQGDKFSDPQPIKVDKSIKSKWDWLWRVSWHNNTGFGVVYQDYRFENKRKINAYLVQTKNGIDYRSITQLKVAGYPNEATVRIKSDGRMFILMRREGGNKIGYLGSSELPYTNWTWNKIGMRLGGPNFIFLPNGQLLIGTRSYNKSRPNTTVLYLSDYSGNTYKLADLPSGEGDTSYPGLIVYKDTLWVSYYHAENEKKTSIYLAKIRFDKILDFK